MLALAALPAAAPFAFEAVLVAGAFFAGEALMLALTAAAPLLLLAAAGLEGEVDFAADLLPEELAAAAVAFGFAAALVAALAPVVELAVAPLRA